MMTKFRYWNIGTRLFR